jgi:S-adenosylmethionine:tRNA ribosyltransferase-isomerase
MTEKLLKSDFYYELPEELIAQDPLEKRDSSRLMVLDRHTGHVKHDTFSKITDYLRPGDLLVLNDTKVIPARLIGSKEETGAAVEILLLRNKGNDIWECLVRPGKKLRQGAKVTFGDGKLKGEICGIADEGCRLVKFTYEGIWEEVLDSLGEMPLPPYITHKLQDKNRYQTVYARYEGSAAAPTAGLHFTDELLDRVRAMGVDTAFVTLHVGLGTFRPVKEDNILDHHMHTEWYEVTKETADKINAVKQSGSGRVICVGTTSCRTLESAADDAGLIKAGSDETDIFIYPGYRFKSVDALITNFHLPESTLIMLVSALGGYENIMAAYKEAVKERYRFFSFGDAMFIS